MYIRRWRGCESALSLGSMDADEARQALDRAKTRAAERLAKIGRGIMSAHKRWCIDNELEHAYEDARVGLFCVEWVFTEDAGVRREEVLREYINRTEDLLNQSCLSSDE